jgi:hypothetical protein
VRTACRAFLRESQSVGNFGIRLGAGAPPATADACDVAVPVHLRHEYPLGTQSIGHLIRDNFHALVEVPAHFGLSSTSFSWATWPRDGGNRPYVQPKVMQKYSGLVSARPAYKWNQLIDACSRGQTGAGACTCARRAIFAVHAHARAELRGASGTASDVGLQLS